MTRQSLLRWLEGGLLAVGVILAAWCAAVLVEARFHSAVPIPVASEQKLKVTQTLILPGESQPLTDPEDAMILNIVTLRPEGQASVNLKGPIVVNRHTLRAKQVIPTNAVDYILRHPISVTA